MLSCCLAVRSPNVTGGRIFPSYINNYFQVVDKNLTSSKGKLLLLYIYFFNSYPFMFSFTSVFINMFYDNMLPDSPAMWSVLSRAVIYKHALRRRGGENGIFIQSVSILFMFYLSVSYIYINK